MKAEFFGYGRHRIGVDGRGVTTLVALHGCPLHCAYCLNPQCHREDTRLMSFSPMELYNLVKKDHLYFLASGGGITFGGGEPLAADCQYFIRFRDICKDHGSDWKLNIETSLHAPSSLVLELLPVFDQWIVDIKDMNPAIYKAYTGLDNKLVLRNLQILLKHGANMTVRVPLIPNYNTLEDVQRSVEQLKAMGVIDIEQFTYTTIE